MYPIARIGGAALAACASVAWIAERLFGIVTPVNTVLNKIATHAVVVVAAFFAIRVASNVVSKTATRSQQIGLHQRSLVRDFWALDYCGIIRQWK